MNLTSHAMPATIPALDAALVPAAGKIIGCELDGQSVTLEPGGQFELSGAPVSTLHQTCAEVNQHLYQVWRMMERALCSGAPGGFRAV